MRRQGADKLRTTEISVIRGDFESTFRLFNFQDFRTALHPCCILLLKGSGDSAKPALYTYNFSRLRRVLENRSKHGAIFLLTPLEFFKHGSSTQIVDISSINSA